LKLKKIISLALEPATSRLVAEGLNHCAAWQKFTDNKEKYVTSFFGVYE
jgi:hypothetical protein